MSRRLFLVLSALTVAACAPGDSSDTMDAADPSAASASLEIGAGVPFDDVPEEVRLRNVRQLTFDGENAEAYFSFDGTQLIFQRTERAEGACDVIWRMDLATGDKTLASTGTGRTTCSYFFPDDQKIIYASTHHVSDQCPAPPDMSRGYVWALYPSYDLFVSNADGTELVQLTDTEGYDAEATISPSGDRMVFTSVRNGDLDLYSMNLDGTDLVQLTDRAGYDGGAFYSPDGSKIVWRAHYPDKRQVTSNGAANFGPFWHPDGERIIWSSNQGDPSGREFDLYMIHEDGTGQERITYTGDFDGFPMFSPDGKYLVWGSNRNPSHQANTNIFIAEWVENPGS